MWDASSGTSFPCSAIDGCGIWPSPTSPKAMKDIMAGKTRANVKTDKLRGRAIVRGGAGTAARTIGLFGGILTYAVELGIIEQNPVHGVRKPKDQVNARRLSEQEYRTLGDILRKAIEDRQYETTAEIIRVIALTGCRRSEVIGLHCGEVDTEGSCLRLTDSKEGASVRPIGLPVLEYLEGRRDEEQDAEDYVFPGWEDDTPFGAFPRQWTKLFKDTDLAGITPHVLRHSFASIGNDLGFTEATIAALVGHSRGTVTSRYIHTVDTALIMAADSIAGYIQGLLDGVAFTHTAYALDRDSRKSALAHFLGIGGRWELRCARCRLIGSHLQFCFAHHIGRLWSTMLFLEMTLPSTTLGSWSRYLMTSERRCLSPKNAQPAAYRLAIGLRLKPSFASPLAMKPQWIGYCQS